MNRSSLLLPLVPFAVAACAPSPEPAEPLRSITVQMGPFEVGPGEERTQCLVTRLGNDAPFDVVKTSSRMTPGSHHLIVYKDASSALGQEPPPEGLGDCDMEAPRLFLYGAQEPDHEDTLPAGVARRLEAGTVLILEAHYANASEQTIEARIDVTLDAAEPGTVEQFAGILFYMDTAFSIPPRAGFDGAPLYTHDTTCAVPEGVNVFRLGSHTHKRGSRFEIFRRDLGAGTDVERLYENTDWHEPYELSFPDDAPLRLASGEGFRFACHWTNESDETIEFGPSVDDEMCIMAGGYWPAVEGPLGMDGNVFCLNGELYY